MLLNLVSPMMTSLMHNRANLPTLLILPIIKNVPNPHSHILLQQHPPPPSCLTHTFPPSRDLPLIIVASSPLEKPAVPLEPPADIVLVRYPAGGFPFFDRLAAGDFVFVYVRVVRWICEEGGDGEAGQPFGWELGPVVLDEDSETAGFYGPPVGAAEGAFVDHF